MIRKIKSSATLKSIIGIVSTLVIFSVVICIVGYHYVTYSLLEQYGDGAFITAYTATSTLDANKMDAYEKSGGETPSYKAAWEKLDQICNATNSTFVYVIRPDTTDYEHITFLFSTINHDSPYEVYDFGYVRETTNDEYKEKYKALYDGTSVKELVVRDKGYIETDPHITAMVPLKLSSGETTAILCVQRQMDALKKTRNGFVQSVILTMIILCMLVIILQSLYLRAMLIRPINIIAAEAGRFSRDNVLTGNKLTDVIKTGDEISFLAGSIDKMEQQIHDYVENLTKVTRENERISTELSLAAQIQEGMLPNIFPVFPERAEFDIYAKMDPAKEVGGDFYDFFLTDKDHLCILIADVSGKGVPAALFMMASKMILGVHARMGKSPAEIIADTNNAVCESNPEEMFFSLWLGILEISTGRLIASNAGHEFPVLQRPGEDFALVKDKHGFVVGGMEDMVYSNYTLQLEKGSKLLLYTDGVPEACNSKKEMYGTDRLIEALNQNPQEPKSVKQVLIDVRASVDDFVQDAEQFDDLTMVCLEYRGLTK